MTRKNSLFESAFGEATPEFEAAMRRAIAEDSSHNTRHVRVKSVLLVAVLAIVLCGAALAAANRFGLIEMLSRSHKVVEDTAEALISNTGEQGGGELPDVKFSLGQVMSDGLQLLFTIKAEAKDPERVMLVDADGGDVPSTNQSIDHWRGRELKYEDWSPVTFEQAAETAGKELVCVYMNGIKIGGESVFSLKQISVAYDEDAIVYAYSVEYKAKPGEPLTLELRINQSDDAQTGESRIVSSLTSSVVPVSSDVTSYSWDEPRAVPELNLIITRVYVDMTPTICNLYVEFKPVDGADEFTLRDVNGIWFKAVNKKGKALPSQGGTKQHKQDGSYLMLQELDPIANFKHVGLKKGKTILGFDVADATVTKGAPNPPEFEPDDFSSPGKTPEGAPFDSEHPSADVALGKGTTIPLLHEFDTAYSGIASDVEALAGNVGLSSTYEGVTVSIDHLAASSGYIWLSYTIKFDEPFYLNYGLDVSEENAKDLASPYFDAIIDGDMDEDAQWSGSIGPAGDKTFYPDERTMRGWVLLDNSFNQKPIPEKFELYLWTGYFANRRYQSAEYGGTQSAISATPFAFKLNVDRSLATANCRSIDLDTQIKWRDQQIKRDREISLVHLSMSPLGNLLIVDELLTGNGNATFNILDDSGKPLTILKSGGSIAGGTKKNPIKRRYNVPFAGGLASKSLTLVPIIEGDNRNTSFIPIDTALPRTATGGDALTVNIESLSIDTNGLSITYGNTYSEMVWFGLKRSENSDDYIDISSEEEKQRFNHATGNYTLEWVWRKQRDANPGERVTAESLEQIKYIEVECFDARHDMDQAVKIALE